MSRPVTSLDLIQQHMDETGLTQDQVILLVGKSVVVRYLAGQPVTKDLFVLKGGTLLHHVYNSPRASIRDADYAHVRDGDLKIPGLKQTFAIKLAGFELQSEEGKWTWEGDIFRGQDLPFTIETEGLKKSGGKLAVSVSVRAAEQLDPLNHRPMYTCRALAYDSEFPVNCLSLNELAAEKILAWCAKRFPRHYADLAVIARDHGPEINPDLVADLVSRKFAREKGSFLYRFKSIFRNRDLPGAFDSTHARQTLSRSWPTVMGGEILLTSQEEGREDTLSDFETADRLVTTFWKPAMDALRQMTR